MEKQNNQLTLLAEKVMAFGSFWGNWYNDGTSTIYNKDWGAGWNRATAANGIYYQNYSSSTLRAWLNSYYMLRNDAGASFSASNSQARFRGFLQEAFTIDEQTIIYSKEISEMKGHGKDSNLSRQNVYETIIDKVWVPSWSEVYGTTMANYEKLIEPIDKDWNTYDGNPNKQFSYFKNVNYNQPNAILNGKVNAFASSQFSNYTVEGATANQNMQNSIVGGNVWWWLRSPSPSYYSGTLVVRADGKGNYAGTDLSSGGVRPAIIIPA